MTRCEELRPTAAGMASLPEGDAERERYLAHARTCPDCMEALREGEKLMRLIEASALPSPSPEVLRRTRNAVLAEFGPPRLQWLLQAAAVVPGFLVPVLIGRHLYVEGWAAAAVVLGAAALLAASAGALKAGALVVLAASAGFAFAAGGVPGIAEAGARLGPWDCPFLELVAAALPVAAAAWTFRKNARPGALAQAAAAGALAGQAALHLACPGRNDPAHLWLLHVSGVGMAALIGWALEGQLRSARS